jgi:hypothetical protein
MPISLKNATSILSWIRYSPQENKLLIADADGKARDVSFLGRSFAIDVENGSMGWLLISEGMRDWKPFPIDSVTPPSPGPNYKRGFSILFYAPKSLGSPEAFEMCASTAAHLSFCERLYNEAEPQFGRGAVPIVRIIEAKETKIGKGKSREIRFEITKWVPRPAAFTEALAKLKASTAAPPDKDDRSADTATGDDFDDDKDATAASPKEGSADKPEKATPEKPKKGRGKAQPEQQNTSDILADPIPY